MTVARDFIFVNCQDGNHRMESIGGANAGCSKDCACSVPVHKCQTCGDCDYGKNEEADDIRKNCPHRPAHSTSQGRCETTLTERFRFDECVCGTYPGNLGPCRTFLPNEYGSCSYCAHRLGCHTAIEDRFHFEDGVAQ